MRFIVIILCIYAALIAPAKTALQFLQEARAPEYAPAHGLLPLTRWAWPLNVELQAELARRWGYALDIPSDKAALSPDAERLVTLAIAENLPVSTNVYRAMFDKVFQTSCPDTTWVHDANGVIVQPRIYSPIMPETVCTKAGQQAAAGIAALRARVPIAIILNGGEYGFMVAGNAAGAYGKDPAILAARGTNEWDKWLSGKKARHEDLVRRPITAVAPGVPYIYYTTGDTRRGMAEGRWVWAFGFEQMATTSSYPSWQFYYGADGRWTWGPNWSDADMLTLALDAAAQGIAAGKPLSYNWVCGGWRGGDVGDDARYEGFLNCLYLAGSIGNVAGYFTYPQSGFNGDVGDTPPDWLRQLMILARVHARFSHLETFLRAGDLAPGPLRHRVLATAPAYELPAGDGVRVLARVLRDDSALLACAWAADGRERWITVDLPRVGLTTLRAAASGALYRIAIGKIIPIE